MRNCLGRSGEHRKGRRDRPQCWWAAGPGRTTSRRTGPHPAAQAPPVWRAPEGPVGTAAVPVGGGRSSGPGRGAGRSSGPGRGAGGRRGLAGLRDTATSKTSAIRPHRCGGRRRDLPRCRWAVAGPGRGNHTDTPTDWKPPRGLRGLAGQRVDAPSEARGADGERAGRPRGGRRSVGATSKAARQAAPQATQTRGSPRGPPRVHATSSHTQHSRECKHSAQSRGRALSAVAQPPPRRPGPRSGRRPCAGCRRRRPG